MRHLRVPRAWYRPLSLLCVLAVVVVAGCAGPYPQSTLNPRGDFADMVDAVFMKTVYLATVVFILVEGALLWAVFKFRGKPTDPEPKQIHGSTVVEIVWTIIPAVVLAVVAVPTVRTIFATARIPSTSADGQPPLKVEVIGHQWFWEFRYPELGITTANELHVPVNRTIDLRMKSNDVIHSFWVPQFAGKRDVFPNRETRLWFTARVTGDFPGACTEFCGTEHAHMDFYITVDPADSFKTWVATRQADSSLNQFGLPRPIPAAAVPEVQDIAGQKGSKLAAQTAKAQAPKTTGVVGRDSTLVAAGDPMVAAGQRLFSMRGCTACHTTNATYMPKTPMVGPSLAGIGSRKMIAGGWLPNSNTNLHRWVKDPQQVKPGVVMQNLGLTDAQVDTVIAYLRTRR